MIHAVLLPAGQKSKQTQSLIRLRGHTSAVFVCMAGLCLIFMSLPRFPFDLGDSVSPEVCNCVFSSCLIFIKQFL